MAEKTGSPDDRVLLVLISADPSQLDALITALLDIGLTRATVVESKGMSALLREEMPIFAGLASLMPERTGSKVLLAASTRKLAESVFEYIEKELKPSERPVCFTTPIERYVGPGV
jgi:hypothetical protein